MPEEIKFYTDENVARAVIRGLEVIAAGLDEYSFEIRG